MTDNPQNKILHLIKIEVVEKKMKVFLTVKEPDTDEIQSLTLQSVLEILNISGIKYGIKEDVLQNIITENKWNEKFLIAEGKPPEPGESARLEFFVSTDKSLKPEVTSNGHLDFKEVHVVNSVEKDTPLVKKFTATLGSTGIDVYGNEIPAILGKDIAMVTAGQGTYKDADDSLLIKSATDGIICYNTSGNTFEVKQLYVIQGSVDYSTGNIHAKSSIEIKGDVKPGFSVTTPYNVEIKGVVEHAVISCDGTLTVKSGIIGDEKLLIKAGGDLHSGYINNQHIKCHGSVFANTEIRNCWIESDNEVKILKEYGVIVGGKITATNTVSAPSIGNLYNIHTEIEVGVVLALKEKYLHKGAELTDAEKDMDELKKKITLMAHASAGNLQNKHLVALKNQWQRSIEHLERLRTDLAEIEKAYYDVANPEVHVNKTIFPGCVIKIKNAVFQVKEELTHGIFKLSEKEITFVKQK
ncbi:MAG: FapA family protein [bacterium]